MVGSGVVVDDVGFAVVLGSGEVEDVVGCGVVEDVVGCGMTHGPPAGPPSPSLQVQSHFDVLPAGEFVFSGQA